MTTTTKRTLATYWSAGSTTSKIVLARKYHILEFCPRLIWAREAKRKLTKLNIQDARRKCLSSLDSHSPVMMRHALFELRTLTSYKYFSTHRPNSVVGFKEAASPFSDSACPSRNLEQALLRQKVLYIVRTSSPMQCLSLFTCGGAKMQIS